MQTQIYRKTLDLQKKGVQWTVIARPTDAASRQIVFTVTDGGKPFYLDDNISAIIYAEKPDGTVLYNDCAVSDGRAVYDITTQTISSVGTVNCELRILSSSNQLITSPKFCIEVEDVISDDNAVSSTNEYTALTNATAAAMSATESANVAASSVNEAIEGAENITSILNEKLENGELKGEKGEKGDKGDTGAQGIQGEKGDKGDTGAQGIQGEKGEKGDKGDTGAQGIQGEKGDKGDKGDTGAQGIQGEKGDKGEQGEKGDAPSVGYISTSTGQPGTYAKANISHIYSTLPSGAVEYSGKLKFEFTIPRGDKGEPGDSYVLTDSDKTEIASIVNTILSDGKLQGIVPIKSTEDLESFYSKVVTETDDGDEIINIPENGYYILLIPEDTPDYEKGIVIWCMFNGDLAEYYLTPNSEKFSEYVKVSDMNSTFEWKQIRSTTTEKDVAIISENMSSGNFGEVWVYVMSNPSTETLDPMGTNIYVTTDKKESFSDANFGKNFLVVPQAYSIFNNSAKVMHFYHFKRHGNHIKCDIYYFAIDKQLILADSTVYPGKQIKLLSVTGNTIDTKILGAGSQIEIWGKKNV